MKRIFTGLILSVLLLLTAGIASAKGGDKVTISGDSLSKDIEITDNSCILNAFSDSNLEDLTTRLSEAPPLASLGTRYLITRYTRNLDDSYSPFDQVEFYSDPAGELGYVHFLKSFYGDTAYDSEWFHPTAQTAFVIQSLLGEPLPGTPDKAVISSGSLPQDIEITTDLCTLSALAVGNLEDPAWSLSAAPKITGDGYLITRYVGDKPYDQVRFYRDPQGGRGYVYDLGLGDGKGTETSGKWFRPSAQSQYVMENLLLSPSTYNGNP
ncbi:MAG: hypothetical protein ABI700_15495 [Chloroflexota bacterium]